MEIKNGTFIVTGGASGLGAATVRTIAAAGGNVVIADVNADAGNALAKELGHARFIKTDVTSEADGKAAVALALKEFGGLQGLINSLIISLSATLLSAVLGTLMAYSFARFNTGGSSGERRRVHR